jgi:hypothetical protein
MASWAGSAGNVTSRTLAERSGAPRRDAASIFRYELTPAASPARCRPGTTSIFRYELTPRALGAGFGARGGPDFRYERKVVALDG